MPRVLRAHYDEYRYHITFYPKNDKEQCAVCLDPLRKNQIVVGHLVQGKRMHYVHYLRCWAGLAEEGEYRLAKSCPLCRGVYLLPCITQIEDNKRRCFTLKGTGVYFEEVHPPSLAHGHIETRTLFQRLCARIRGITSRVTPE
jgi:hypothetical protein